MPPPHPSDEEEEEDDRDKGNRKDGEHEANEELLHEREEAKRERESKLMNGKDKELLL